MSSVPLTRQQQRIWLQRVVSPGSAAYNVATALRFRGELDVDALARAWTSVVERHDALRARLIVADGAVRLEVTTPHSVPLTARAAELTDDIEALVIDVGSHVFPVGQPLVRAELIELGASDQLLVITADHLVFDGWSAGIVVEELLGLYDGEALPAEPAPTLAELHALDEGPSSAEQRTRALAYWTDRLRDAPYFSLPADRARPLARSHATRRARTTLTGQSTDRLRELAAASRTTPANVVLAVFAALLARLGGESDVVVGMPVVDRQFRGSERAVGFFTTTLPLRIDARPELPFTAVLTDAVARTRDAYAHSHVPFDEIVAAVNPARQPTRNPIFSVWFNVVPMIPIRQLRSVQVDDVTPPTLAALFDVGLYCRLEPNRAVLTLVLDDELFDPWRADAMLAALTSLFEQAVASPDAPAGSHPLPRSPAPAAAPVRAPSGLLERLERVARGRDAVVDSARSLTYGDLLDDARRVAWWLHDFGIAPGDVVALRATRSASLPVGMLGVIGSGATLLLLDRDGLAERATEYAERAGARLVLDDRQLPLGDRRPSWPADTAATPYVVVTSGSTGLPHAVRARFDAVANFVDWHVATFGLGDDDRFALVSGIGHDPVFRDVFTPLAIGAPLHVPDGELLAWLRTQRITILHATPPVVRLLYAAAAGGTLPDLRNVFFGGDVLTAADVEQAKALAPNARLVNFYGTTETPQAVSCFVAHDPAAPRPDPLPLRVPIGPGVAASELVVLTPAGIPAGIGELGELHVRSGFLADGYLGEPELTDERFSTVEGRRSFATGDLARPRPDGSFDFAGRSDRQHKVRGFRVESAEIERHLRRHPGVVDAWATVIRDEAGEQVVAYAVAVEPERPPRAEDVREFAAGVLPSYMVPTRIAVVPRLPTTANGKVDIAPLRALRPAEPPAVDGGDIADVVRGVWQHVLGTSSVDADANFFDVGGSSLALVGVQEELERRLGRAVPLLLLFDHSTIRSLARALAGDPGEEKQAGPPGEANRQRRLEASRRRRIEARGTISKS